MATIIPGGFTSAWMHHRHEAVRWDVVKSMLPGLLVGTASGAVLAHFASTAFLKTFLSASSAFLAAQLLFNLEAASHRALPERAGLIALPRSWA